MKNVKLLLLLLAALLIGACIGYRVSHAVIRSRIRHFSRVPANLPEHIAQRLTERLNLDEEQQEQVRAVLYSHHDRMKGLREQSQAMLDDLMNTMREDIVVHLRPDQVVKFQDIVEERRRIMKERGELLRAYPPPAADAQKP